MLPEGTRDSDRGGASNEPLGVALKTPHTGEFLGARK